MEHYVDHHPEKKEPRFKLEMVKSFKTPLERQIFEGVKIAQSKAIPINRMGESGQNVPPRFRNHEDQEQIPAKPHVSKNGTKRKTGRKGSQADFEGKQSKRLRPREDEALTTMGATDSPAVFLDQKQSQFSLERGKGQEGAAKGAGTDAGTLDPIHGQS